MWPRLLFADWRVPLLAVTSLFSVLGTRINEILDVSTSKILRSVICICRDVSSLLLKTCINSSFLLIKPLVLTHCRCRGLLLQLIILRHTKQPRTPLDKWSARRSDLYLTTYNTNNKQTSMSAAGFKPAFPANEQPQTHALDRAATGTGP
jgi:hypothetical protein